MLMIRGIHGNLESGGRRLKSTTEAQTVTEASHPSVPVAAPPPAPVPPVPPAPTHPGAPAQLARRVAGGFDLATRRQTVIVAAVLAAMFFGTQVLDEALPAAASPTAIETTPGNPVSIGEGWQITPLVGWEATPHDSGSGIRLEKGVVVVDLAPESFDSAGDLAVAYRDQVLKADATQLTTTDIETTSASGGSAARFNYQGIFPESDGAIEGEVTAIVAGGTGVIADAWSPQGDLGDQLGDIHQMIDTIASAQ
jgi:hypothetical protein